MTNNIHHAAAWVCGRFLEQDACQLWGRAGQARCMLLLELSGNQGPGSYVEHAHRRKLQGGTGGAVVQALRRCVSRVQAGYSCVPNSRGQHEKGTWSDLSRCQSCRKWAAPRDATALLTSQFGERMARNRDLYLLTSEHYQGGSAV